jgi:hypothetical protein
MDYGKPSSIKFSDKLFDKLLLSADFYYSPPKISFYDDCPYNKNERQALSTRSKKIKKRSIKKTESIDASYYTESYYIEYAPR